MIIGIDASRANNDQKTGVEWYAYFVIQELKKIIPAGVEVRLYSREALKGDLASLPPNWQVQVLKWPPRRLWTQLRLSYEMWHNPPDVLFVPAHVLPLICPQRTVMTVHDLGGLRFPAGYSWFEVWYTKWATQWALKRAKIITPSAISCREIKQIFQADSTDISVIPNAYDQKSFQEITDQNKINAVLARYKISRPYFLSIGRLEEKKNTRGIIQAFEIFRSRFTVGTGPCACPSHRLVLLGKPGFGFDRVQEAINQSQYKSDIILPGWVATADVPCLMAGATAFVFPSFYEGFGIPILEAFASGTPVITSNLASCPEVAGGAGLLVNPHKPAEIAQAMADLADSAELSANLKAQGKEVAKKYSWEATAQGVWRVLQQE
jgi:glycosyltransferase involved in cell wall biosynthesis